MKTYWNIDIENKIASFKENEVIYKISFEIEFKEFLNIKTNRVIKDNNKIDILKMHNYMRNLGDELILLHFEEKLIFNGYKDGNGIKMYQIEDNIYMDEEGTLNILNIDGFYYTDYSVDLFDDNNIENSIKALIKMSVYEDIDETPDFKYLTWNEFKINIGLNS